MATKTNAVRLVQQAGIPCREAFYEFDEQDLSGVHAAQAIGMPEEQVFKTLVARGEKTGINVFCIPVCCELDLKKAAKAAGDKNMELVAVKELLGLTGYIRGGCGLPGRGSPVYCEDEWSAAVLHELVDHTHKREYPCEPCVDDTVRRAIRFTVSVAVADRRETHLTVF